MEENINIKIIRKKEIAINKKEIFLLIKDAESINQYYKDSLKSFDLNYIITPKDIKKLNFIFQYFFKSLKHKDIQIFFRLKNKKIISKQNSNRGHISKKLIEKNKYFIPKFINFCLINKTEFAKYLNIPYEYFTDNILKIIKILFLNDFITEKEMKYILFIQIILCLYKKKEKFLNIQNINQIYLVINYLLSFCSNNNYNMNDNKIEQFNDIISYIIDEINDYVLVNKNYTNKYLLSKNKSFYNIIGLSGIGADSVKSKIIKILVYIYAYQLNIDYVFDDLSEQFLYKIEKETILNKTNLLIEKNNFINSLLEKEKFLLKEEELFIKNGFYFSDFPNNGIECHSINTFPNKNDGYSIVISFRLMNNNA